MWRRACPVITALLAGGLVLARRRLNDAKAELERQRDEVERQRDELKRQRSELEHECAELERERGALRATQALAAAPHVPGDGIAATSSHEQAEITTTGSDLSWEWEQGALPSDS